MAEMGNLFRAGSILQSPGLYALTEIVVIQDDCIMLSGCDSS